MNNYKIEVKNICKSFNGTNILKNICLNASVNNSLAITGKNGSGKSTLIKILIGYLHNEKGNIEYFINQNKLLQENFYKHFTIVAPYYNFYEEFSTLENIELALKLRDKNVNYDLINATLNHFGLINQNKKLVKYFSSGMKQRLKFCLSKLINSEFIFVDEPTSNLDNSGKEIVENYLMEVKTTSCLIFATNETHEIKIAENILNIS